MVFRCHEVSFDTVYVDEICVDRYMRQIIIVDN
jgi:hypothetical protein